ncbi:hypothetical protein [Moraxella lacunata]|uniref:hypothetical protein n=1 Tax=Moraxella lacunata TaxID=477 RepID=UPI003EE2D64E
MHSTPLQSTYHCVCGNFKVFRCKTHHFNILYLMIKLIYFNFINLTLPIKNTAHGGVFVCTRQD